MADRANVVAFPRCPAAPAPAEPPITREQADRVLIAAATGLQAGLAQALMNAGMLLTALQLRADATRAGRAGLRAGAATSGAALSSAVR